MKPMRASTRSGVMYAVVFALLCIGLVVLYDRSQAVDAVRYSETITKLRELSQADAQWSDDVLRSKLGLSLDYDALVTPVSRVQEIRASIGTLLKALGFSMSEPLLVADREMVAAVYAKAELVERFKTSHAVLRNSLSFLPLAADEAIAKLPAGPQSAKLAEEIRRVLLYTMRYNLVPTEEGEEQVLEACAATDGAAQQFSPQVYTVVETFIIHVHAVLRHHRLVTEVLQQIATSPTSSRIDGLIEELSRDFQKAQERAEMYRQALAGYAALLGALVLFFSIRLGASYAAIARYNQKLQVANENLEQRVAERTAELSGALDGLQAANREISAQRDIAERANAFKGELMGIAAHDLKNPLSAIRLAAELIELDADAARDDPTVLPVLRSTAQDIHQQTKHMLKLIEDLLNAEASEQHALRLEPRLCEWRELAKRVIADNRAQCERKGQVLLFPPGAEPVLNLDMARMREAMDNLISNAIKYSPPGAEIRVELTEQDGEACFAVSDQGPGLTETDRAQLFQRFRRLSARPTGGESSTGLGLSIAHTLVMLHGGRIEVTNREQGGARFAIVLPVEEAR